MKSFVVALLATDLRVGDTAVQSKDSEDGFHLGGPDLEPETHRQCMYLL